MGFPLSDLCSAIRIPALFSLPMARPYVNPSFFGPDNPGVSWCHAECFVMSDLSLGFGFRSL